jgi:uncharacterized protein (TIGR00369 family)
MPAQRLLWRGIARGDQVNDNTRPPRQIGLIGTDQLRELDGIDLFRGMLDGRFPAAPITETLGFRLHEAEPGRVVFAGEPERRHYNPIGSVHGGFAATLLDSAMSCAVHSHLKKGSGYTTVEFKVNFVRAMTDATGTVYCEGKSINVGSRIGTAEGRIVDSTGRLYAHGTATCLIFPI